MMHDEPNPAYLKNAKIQKLKVISNQKFRKQNIFKNSKIRKFKNSNISIIQKVHPPLRGGDRMAAAPAVLRGGGTVGA